MTLIFPCRGPRQGGTRVRIYGKWFPNSISLGCLFGISYIPARWITTSELECLSPPKKSGIEVSVRITSNKVDISQSYQAFAYQGDDLLLQIAFAI